MLGHPVAKGWDVTVREDYQFDYLGSPHRIGMGLLRLFYCLAG